MTLNGATIVAIDDAPSIRTFLRVSLQDEGAQIFEAATGMDGTRLCEEKNPDLVVLDLGLPDMDGMEVLAKLKSKPQAPTVIILSVRKNQESFIKAAELGADGYLTKPFLVEDLLELIEERLARKTAS